MKNLAAKLKGLNYKQAFIDHGEKVVLSVIGLFVLICLAGTSWSRYDKQPEEFTKKVEQGEAAIKASAWTEEKKAGFKSTRDISQAVKMLHSPLDTSRYVYSTNWYWPMYPTGVKVMEPRWLAPIQPIADGGKFVMIENPIEPVQGRDLALVEGAPGATPKEDDEDFAVRKPANNAAGGANAGAPLADSGIIAGAGPVPSKGAYEKMMAGTAGMDSPAQSGPTINARGTRFVAIRSVFPLGDQLDELVKAMHENKQKAAELIEFMDFEVERQVAQPGDKPWSGKWEKVDFQATLELLERVDFDTELVDLAYTDAVFTMPLPRRVIGNWKKFASHPLIKAMSDEQVEMQAQLAQRMAEEAEKQKKDEPGKKKGLSRIQVDGRQLRIQFSGGNQMAGMMADMAKSGSPSFSGNFDAGGIKGMMGDPSIMGGFQDQMTRNNGRMSKYLLLRYFDFQVNPGNAYRYRMRVTLKNPNFKRPVEELVQEETALAEVRVTPWSEPTPLVFIPNEERIFLTKADKAKIETGLPSAYLDVYQWFSEAGTTIAAKLEKLQLGQFVGGRPKPEVFRPANNTLGFEEVPVFTGSVLADIAATPSFDADFLAENADLKLDAKKLKLLGVVDKALLVDRFGQLVTLDPKAAADDHAQSEKTVENERRSIRATIKERGEVASAPNDLKRLGGKAGGAAGAGMMGADDPMSLMMQKGAGNPLKKGGGKAAKKPVGKNSGGGAPAISTSN